MSELDDFLTETLARQVEEEEALHNGDVQPRLAMWSMRDPVTVFGALKSASGWDEVSRGFRWVASRFSDCTTYRFELLAAGISGDLAYTVGYEHISASRSNRLPCASPTSTAARTASGRSFTATPTAFPAIRHRYEPFPSWAGCQQITEKRCSSPKQEEKGPVLKDRSEYSSDRVSRSFCSSSLLEKEKI